MAPPPVGATESDRPWEIGLRLAQLGLPGVFGEFENKGRPYNSNTVSFSTKS